MIPPKPIRNFIYNCGRTFLTNEIEHLYETNNFTTGVIITCGESTNFYLLSKPDSKGNIERKLVSTITAYIPTGHKKGGQSAPRFQRMYLSALEAYIKQIVEKCLIVFRENGVNIVKSILISGNGIRPKHISDELVKCMTIPFRLFSYDSVYELIEKEGKNGFEVFDGEKKIFESLLKQLELNSDILVFGKTEVLNNFNSLEKIYTTIELDCDFENRIVKISEPHFCDWLNNFGGCIGVKFYVE